ncbi:MAG: hydratase [Clostridia bacterium]|nr:hydratase [Clostridia bacterium]
MQFTKGKILIKNGTEFVSENINAKEGTISYSILSAHNTGDDINKLKIKFDALVSHDITYVGIIQTARASGLKKFPLTYALTNCHNSLCAVGGTLNEDDHLFGLSAAKKYGGMYVPPHLAVIHSFAREELAACGKMILGSDSHTRYGALGTMAIGEGGPELVKQLLERTYDVDYPEIIAVYLKGKVRNGVGPHDVAIAMCKEVFAEGKVKNKVLEFIGPGVDDLSVDFRCGIDVMTTETTCLSSIWKTDEKVREYYKTHGREQDYACLEPKEYAEYDGLLEIDLSEIEPMIALPFHPSNAYTIREFKANAKEILASLDEEIKKQYPKCSCCVSDKLKADGFHVDQGVIAGCAGGIFENITCANDILKGGSTGNDAFSLNVYPASQSVYLDLVQKGVIGDLMESGAVVKTAFCGPCFGAGDVPANNAFSIRHTTRNFPNREGSKPGEGQLSLVALMDARSIAATAAAGGILTGADEIEFSSTEYEYTYHRDIYVKRVYDGRGNANEDEELILGPNIADWPALKEMPEQVLLKISSVLRDKVTTTDELIPSGETSTLRSNPYKLSRFTLSRKDPDYVLRADAVAEIENSEKRNELFAELNKLDNVNITDCVLGSCIYANMPGDGSAREQAASCQKVLGGWGNIALEYATKRYRSNLINWGILPLLCDEKTSEAFENDSYVFLPEVKSDLLLGKDKTKAVLIKDGKTQVISLGIVPMTKDERDILLSGGLINYYSKK